MMADAKRKAIDGEKKKMQTYVAIDPYDFAQGIQFGKFTSTSLGRGKLFL